MDFDNNKCAKLINEFIQKGEKIKSFRGNEIPDAIAPLCRLLRISRLTACVHYSIDGDNNRSQPWEYFNDGAPDESRKISFKEKLIKDGSAEYVFFPAMGDEDWDEHEISVISIIEKQLFMLTERSNTQRIISELTLHDNELGIKTLSHLMTTAGSLINHGLISEYGAVQFNLKRFSSVNEKLGRSVANKVLKLFVQGLQEKLNREGCVCRIGSDNFAALFHKDDLNSVKQYLSGRHIIYGSEQETIKITATAGYYLIPEGVDSSAEIMERARAACQLARNVFRKPYLFYDDEIAKRQERVREIELMFPQAIAHEEFKVFYQPKTQLNNYRIAGAEALCRWFRDGKIVPPGEFIPVLESSKSICTLDFYMLARVCRDIRRWLKEGKDVVKVSVNLSRLHLGDEDLLETIIGIIDKYDVPHKYIEIELTETTTDVDYAELKKLVYGLREQEISTSVDDFGMGYSSLNLIREMPWNVLKIDKSFLPTREENRDQSKVKMLRHIISMSQDLGLECIVEGVETAEQVKLLKECKCYLAQGFYFDRPLPVSEFEQRLDCLRVC